MHHQRPDCAYVPTKGRTRARAEDRARFGVSMSILPNRRLTRERMDIRSSGSGMAHAIASPEPDGYSISVADVGRSTYYKGDPQIRGVWG